jgi:1-acyl-sn-glycerol-3-phosphate acyltransferase
MVRHAVDPDDVRSVDPDLVAALAPWVDAVCRAWFRLEVDGLERLPDGPALLVGNHNSGTTFVEAMGFGARAIMERGTGDLWAGLAHDAVVDFPILGSTLVRVGAVRAGHDAAMEAFAQGRKVVVFPGGNAEAFRPWSARHQVDLQGRTGWIRLAIDAGVPIVPVVFEGGHNGLFIVRSGRRFARWSGAKRWLRVDTWPLWLGLPWGVAWGPMFHLPLPVKCRTEVLPPVTSHLGRPLDDALLQEVYQQVVGDMQQVLSRLARA